MLKFSFCVTLSYRTDKLHAIASQCEPQSRCQERRKMPACVCSTVKLLPTHEDVLLVPCELINCVRSPHYLLLSLPLALFRGHRELTAWAYSRSVVYNCNVIKIQCEGAYSLIYRNVIFDCSTLPTLLQQFLSEHSLTSTQIYTHTHTNTDRWTVKAWTSPQFTDLTHQSPANAQTTATPLT